MSYSLREQTFSQFLLQIQKKYLSYYYLTERWKYICACSFNEKVLKALPRSDTCNNRQSTIILLFSNFDLFYLTNCCDVTRFDYCHISSDLHYLSDRSRCEWIATRYVRYMLAARRIRVIAFSAWESRAARHNVARSPEALRILVSTRRPLFTARSSHISRRAQCERVNLAVANVLEMLHVRTGREFDGLLRYILIYIEQRSIILLLSLSLLPDKCVRWLIVAKAARLFHISGDDRIAKFGAWAIYPTTRFRIDSARCVMTFTSGGARQRLPRSARAVTVDSIPRVIERSQGERRERSATSITHGMRA